jgi:hypothetical protein
MLVVQEISTHGGGERERDSENASWDGGKFYEDKWPKGRFVQDGE